MIRFYQSLILLWLCAMLISCSADSKGESLQAEEKLFVEISVGLAQAAQEYGDDPSGLARAQASVFMRVGLDQQKFGDLARRLEKSPQRWIPIWKRIIKRLEEEEEREG